MTCRRSTAIQPGEAPGTTSVGSLCLPNEDAMRSNTLRAVVRAVGAVCAWSVVSTSGCGDLPLPNRLDPTPLRPVVAEVRVSNMTVGLTV